MFTTAQLTKALDDVKAWWACNPSDDGEYTAPSCIKKEWGEVFMALTDVEETSMLPIRAVSHIVTLLPE